MSLWNQMRLIDILCDLDISLLEEEIPERDLEQEPMLSEENEENHKAVSEPETVLAEVDPKKKRGWNRKRIAAISGIAASSIALTGVVMLAYKKHGQFKKAA